MPFTLHELAERLSGHLHGDGDTSITGVAAVETAEAGDLVFAEAPKYLIGAVRSRAAAVLVTPELAAGAGDVGKPLLAVASPRVAFVEVMDLFAPGLDLAAEVHPTAVIAPGAKIGSGVRIGAHVVIGDEAEIGDGVALYPGVVVGAECRIGAGTVIRPNVTLYPGVTIGRACILHAGAVIGADGFGYVQIGPRLKKIPQLGTVEIGDEVEIGANTCIDRAKTSVTRIGSGTKIDNLVHIAHNVTVGQSCLFIAQAGVAGSVSIGHGVVLAGQAGIKDHVRLGDGARVAAQGGVIGDVAPGVTVSGYPARPHAEKMRELAALSSLPEALKRIKSLERRLAELESRAPAGMTHAS